MFRCKTCALTALKWSGKCLGCGAWETLEKIPDEPKNKKSHAVYATNMAPKLINEFLMADKSPVRLTTGLKELDFLLGGGIVPGALILLSGEPGIGKSTLVAQIAGTTTQPVLYVSGEESGEQIALRLQRLKIKNTELTFLSTTDYTAVATTINTLIKKERPALIIIDSVQTLRHPDVAGEAGGMAQIRAITNALLELANTTNVPIILIGHVTKDGSVAGPKTLEHLVDVVLTIEGDRSDRVRFVRCFKNRFGPTDEVAVLEMTENGLTQVIDPGGLLLQERSLPVPGSVVTCLMDGNRPLLVEIQALTTRTAFGMPARRANGIDQSRLQMLIAVLGRRMGLPVDSHDIFVNVVGGVNADEPATDLAICMAIASAIADKTIPQTVVAFGEVGLSGEIRRVRATDKRLREAEARGFLFAIAPKMSEPPKLKTLKLSPITDIKSVLEKIEK